MQNAKLSTGYKNIGGGGENILSIHWYVIGENQTKLTEEYSKDRLFPRNRSYHIMQLSSFHI